MRPPLPIFKPLPTPEEMRAWDEAAQTRFGMPAFLLMENAAREAWSALTSLVAPNAHTKALVIMGGGGNGGDGAALARRLHEAGCGVLVYCSRPLDSLRGAAAEHVAAASACGTNFLPAGEEVLNQALQRYSPNLVIDALTGTGIRSDLREAELSLVRMMNSFKQKVFIFSLDIPSGLCGYTGKPRPEAVRADATVTFEAGKPGLCFPEAGPYTGKVIIRSIGLPGGARGAAAPSWRLISPTPGAWALPSPLRHKGEAGRVLIIGGSTGTAGAPVLSALGALRAGAGLVHLAYPGGLGLPGCPPEIMAHPLGEDITWNEAAAENLPALIDAVKPRVVLLGPGIGRGAGAHATVKAVLEHTRRPPTLLDADAISFFRLPDARPEVEKKRGPLNLSLDLLHEGDILTPHPGEMAKLLPCSYFPDLGDHAGDDPLTLRACIMELQEDRAGALRAFTRQSPAVLVLKGPGTLVGKRGAPTALCPIAAPALAVGGSGDVLGGVIAALQAGGLPALEAACLGVHLHASAGEILGRKAPLGHLASEIAGAVPAAFALLCEEPVGRVHPCALS